MVPKWAVTAEVDNSTDVSDELVSVELVVEDVTNSKDNK